MLRHVRAHLWIEQGDYRCAMTDMSFSSWGLGGGPPFTEIDYDSAHSFVASAPLPPLSALPLPMAMHSDGSDAQHDHVRGSDTLALGVDPDPLLCASHTHSHAQPQSDGTALAGSLSSSALQGPEHARSGSGAEMQISTVAPPARGSIGGSALGNLNLNNSGANLGLVLGGKSASPTVKSDGFLPADSDAQQQDGVAFGFHR